MQSPMLYHSAPGGYPWHSRRLAYKLHFLVLVCLTLNLLIAALVILVQQKKLFISDRPVYKMGGNGQSAYYWKSLLPAIGSIVGSINAYIAGGGIALLVSSYAKHQGLNRGLSLKKISHLGQLGLSGRVSTLASDVISSIVGESAISVTSETVAISCLPRTKVTVACKTNLDGTGLSYTNRGESGTSFWFKTQEMQFCNSAGTCNSDYRTNFNDGTVFVSLLLVATGKYATDLGTPQVFCRVSAEESFLPIQVQGFNAAQVGGYSCPENAQSSSTASFLTNVTFMSQMAMQKMQGQDGRLEILSLINNTQGRTKGEMLEGALEKMLEIGATEMYTHLPNTNAALNQRCALQTPRTVLGSRTAYGYLWAIPPAILALIFLIGWICLGFRRAAQAYWSPLDPACMAVSGVAVPKNSSLYAAVSPLAGASTDHIHKCMQGPLRLAEVDPGHLALTMDDPDSASVPQKGRVYGASPPHTPTSTNPAMSPEVKVFTPMIMTPDQTAAYQATYYNSNNGSYFPAGSAPANAPPYHNPYTSGPAYNP
ncbi:hypothetical protein QFC21_002131 [Naganishia friedmannii]|uniref:Uncharacterized protein n=1 Tax=Naganishia friedmannii TaxID=89922 RepID=A0ACC2VZ24_9TREE|nr:hypothetical protein QFC21_002131 [Naganishia friedmannii]